MQEVLVTAYGPLGLRPKDLAPLSFSDYLLMTMGNLRKEEQEWSRTREVLAAIFNTAMGAKRRDLKGKDLLPLSIDEANAPADQDAEIMQFLATAIRQ